MPLIAHFKLNGDTIDTIGTYSSNTPTAITYTNLGKLDGAAIFNGSSSAILLGTTINLAGNANWTVSAWVKTTSTARMSILSNSSGGPVMNDICIEGGKIAYYHYNAAWLFKQGTISINDGNWHHLVWVNFTGNKMNMYVDGKLDQHQVDSTQSTGPVNQIGKNWSTAYFNGTMDDLRIYTGASITENEILQLSFNKRLIFHYPLIGNINDYTRSYTQTSSTINYTNFGKIGQALDMGGNSWIQPTGFDGTAVSSFTLAFWLYNVNSGTAGLFGNISGTRSISVFRYPALNDMHCSFGGVGSTVDTGVLAYDSWTHVLITFDGITSQLKRYYNGVLYATSTVTRNMNTNPIYIARNDSGQSAGRLNDVRLYNYILSEYEIQELTKVKILHYNFDNPYEEPTSNIFPRQWNELAFTSAFNGTNYGFGAGTDLQQNFDDSLALFNSRITKVSRITGGSTQADYVHIGISSPAGSTRIISFWYYGTFGTLIRPYNNDASANLFYLNSSGNWVGGSTGVDIPVVEKVWQKITIRMVNNGSAGTGWSWFIMHYNSISVNLTNNEYWAFSEFQVEDKLFPTPYTRTERNIGVIDYSGYKYNGTFSAIAQSPRYVTDSKLGSGSFYFDGTTPHIITGLTAMGAMTSCTISFWRKNDTTITHWLPFVGQTTSFYIMATSAGTGGFYHAQIGTSWEIFKDGVGQGVGVAATPFTDQNWHHYAIRGVNLSAWTAFKISGYDATWSIEGYMDDVRVYSNSLSNADILALYNRRANLDNMGNVQINDIDLTGSYFPPVVDYSTWTVGQTSATNWSRNGTAAENIIIVKDNPVNQQDIMWATLGNDATSDDDGGFNSGNGNIDKTKKYRYSVWIKRENIGNGRTYFGCGWSQVSNLGATEVVNSNPYFDNYIPSEKPNIGEQWVLLVGHVHPTGYTGSTDTVSGIYNVNGTKLYNIATDYKWLTTSTVGMIRAYLFYSTSTTERQYFYRPRIDMIDGNEPSLESLLGCADNPTLFGKTLANINKKALFNDKGQAIFNNIDEVSGTKNSAAQHEITNTGTLLINGEFSEVN